MVIFLIWYKAKSNAFPIGIPMEIQKNLQTAILFQQEFIKTSDDVSFFDKYKFFLSKKVENDKLIMYNFLEISNKLDWERLQFQVCIKHKIKKIAGQTN